MSRRTAVLDNNPADAPFTRHLPNDGDPVHATLFMRRLAQFLVGAGAAPTAPSGAPR